MKPQSSGAFLIKRPFDLQEAVVLLDVYLSMVKNGVPITMAAEKASVRLRNLAKSNGYIVSDSYRSSGGLVNRLRSLGGLYEGQESKSAPGTAKFAEAISLYNNERARYEEILSTERHRKPLYVTNNPLTLREILRFGRNGGAGRWQKIRMLLNRIFSSGCLLL